MRYELRPACDCKSGFSSHHDSMLLLVCNRCGAAMEYRPLTFMEGIACAGRYRIWYPFLRLIRLLPPAGGIPCDVMFHR